VRDPAEIRLKPPESDQDQSVSTQKRAVTSSSRRSVALVSACHVGDKNYLLFVHFVAAVTNSEDLISATS
jgi:hypothetical protein